MFLFFFYTKRLSLPQPKWGAGDQNNELDMASGNSTIGLISRCCAEGVGAMDDGRRTDAASSGNRLRSIP